MQQMWTILQHNGPNQLGVNQYSWEAFETQSKDVNVEVCFAADTPLTLSLATCRTAFVHMVVQQAGVCSVSAPGRRT